MQDQARRVRVWRQCPESGVTLWAVLSTAFSNQLPVIWSKQWEDGTPFTVAEAKSITRRYPNESGTAPIFEEGKDEAA
jgi:hypothetical protein